MGARSRVCLVSGGQRLRLRSHVGHKIHAQLTGIDYHVELGPYPNLPNGYFHKVAAIGERLEAYEWIIWIDDDAFVTDHGSTRFLDLIAEAEQEGSHVLIGTGCERELNDAWARLNSGVFMVRGSAEGGRFLEDVLAADLEDIESTWDATRNGMFTGGDQDAILSVLDAGGVPHTVVDGPLFNARPWLYDQELTDQFVVHFPGHPDKRIAIEDFARRFGLDDRLVPPALLARFGEPPLRPMPAPELLWRRAGRVGRRVHRRVRRKAAWVRTHRRWS